MDTPPSIEELLHKNHSLEKQIIDALEKKEKTQNALHESQERFRLIFDTSFDAILISNIESGAIFDANKAFLNLSGFSRNSIIGKTINEIGIWENKNQRDACISKLKQDGYYDNLEAKLFLNNRTISTLVCSRLLHLDDVTHVISIIRDISDRKHLEKQGQQMEAITTLAGGIAKDFNTILSGMIGSLELLNLDFDIFSNTHRENVTKALISSKQAAKLIRQLQILTQSDSGKPSSIDMYKVISDVFNILEQAPHPLIHKKIDLLENQYYVQGFYDELHQVLMNLGMNAVEAIEEKGAPPGSTIQFFAVKDNTLQQRPSALPNTGYHHFCFQDSGCGMLNTVKQKAFDPMFSTKKVSDKKSRGLGLTMVFYIISTKYEGIIDIETTPGVGTTIHLYLPAAKKPTPDEKRATIDVENSRTVLVIEDEHMVRDMAVNALKSFGYNTLEASDGEMGLNVFKKNYQSIDAILLDVIMPKMSGTQIFKQMLKMNPDIKVIIASGHVTNTDQKKIFTKASAYLDKPYQIMELKQALQSIFK